MNLKPIISLLVSAGVIGTAAAGHTSQPTMKKHTATKVSSSYPQVLSGNSALKSLPKSSMNGVGFSAEASVGYYFQSKKNTEGSSNTEDQNKLLINNMNLFLTGKVNPSIDTVFNVYYGNMNSTLGKIFNDISQDGLILDEAYVTYFNQSTSPIFVKVGRYYQDFGNYENPYVYNKGIVQTLTQFKGDGITLGGMSQGVYGSVFSWQPSPVDKQLYALTGEDSIVSKKPFNNFGFKVGYQSKVQDVKFNANFSFLNNYFQTNIARSTDSTKSAKNKAYQIFANAAYKGLSLKGTYTALSGNANIDHQYNTKPKVWGLGGSYSYNLSNLDQSISLDYAKMSKSGYDFEIRGIGKNAIANLPSESVSVDYHINLNKKIGLGASAAKYKISGGRSFSGLTKFSLYNISLTAKI
jgi:hypothetical protein